MATDLIKKTKVQEETGMRVSSELYKELDSKVQEMLEAAEQRASANNRKTLQPQDL